MQELEGYWQLTARELSSFGGNPVFEMRADGTAKMSNRFGKVKGWKIEPAEGDYWLVISLVDNMSTPMTLRGRLMLSEYFPLVVERGQVLKLPRSGGEQVMVGEFELRKV